MIWKDHAFHGLDFVLCLVCFLCAFLLAGGGYGRECGVGVQRRGDKALDVVRSINTNESCLNRQLVSRQRKLSPSQTSIPLTLKSTSIISSSLNLEHQVQLQSHNLTKKNKVNFKSTWSLSST